MISLFFLLILMLYILLYNFNKEANRANFIAATTITALSLLCYQYIGNYNEVYLLKSISENPQKTENISKLYKQIKKGEKTYEWKFILAQLYFYKDQYNKSIVQLQEILSNSKIVKEQDKAIIYYYLAKAHYYNDGKASEKTYQLLTQAITLNDSDKNILGFSGAIATELHHYQDALKFWNRLYELENSAYKREKILHSIQKLNRLLLP